jgi:hypothetical protein
MLWGPLSQLHPDLSLALDAVFRALAYAPADRFASCEQLADVFAEIAQKHGLAVAGRTVARWVGDNLARMCPVTNEASKSEGIG